MRRLATRAALALALCGVPLPAAADGLQPYQMVRSLQLLQDRIAAGDHAALPMQTRLLGIIDERLRAAQPQDYRERRNLEALLVYGASGGNPATLETIVSRLELDGQNRVLAEGIVAYTRGDLAGARHMLRDLEPLALDDALAAPLALLVGSLLVQENPARALRLFDEARLLSPGTLIEEAALRRIVTVGAGLGETRRVARAALQYVRRFPRSPYASQFAESFVGAVVALHETIDLDLVEQVMASMSDEHARAIYLRIARASAIDGHGRLLAFAARRAEAGDPDGRDPRARLYANLAAVASPDVEEVLESLQKIDTTRLSASDRRLLRAATAVARQIVIPPASTRAAAGTDAQEEAAHTAFVSERMERLAAIDALLEEEQP